MPTVTTIRAGVPADSAAIASLMNALNREEGYSIAANEKALAAALFGENREVALSALVAESEGRILGALLYYPGYDTLSSTYGHHLADIIVSQAHRRCGIGKKLIAALAERMLATHKEWLSLTVLSHNAGAIRFYQSLGLQHVEVDFYAIGKTALARL